MAGNRTPVNNFQDIPEIQALLAKPQGERGTLFQALPLEKRNHILERIFASPDPQVIISQYKNFINMFSQREKDALNEIMHLTSPFINKLVLRATLLPGTWTEEKIYNAFVSSMEEFNAINFKLMIEASPFVKISRNLNQKSSDEVAAFIKDKAKIVSNATPDEFLDFYNSFSLQQQNAILKALVDNNISNLHTHLAVIYADLRKWGKTDERHQPLVQAIYDLLIKEQSLLPDQQKDKSQLLQTLHTLPDWIFLGGDAKANEDKFRQAMTLTLPHNGKFLADVMLEKNAAPSDVFKNETSMIKYIGLDKLTAYIKNTVLNLSTATPDKLIDMYKKLEEMAYLLVKHNNNKFELLGPDFKPNRQLYELLQTEAKHVLTAMVANSKDKDQMEATTLFLSKLAQTAKSSPLSIPPKQSKLSLGFIKKESTNEFEKFVLKTQQQASASLMTKKL